MNKNKMDIMYAGTKGMEINLVNYSLLGSNTHMTTGAPIKLATALSGSGGKPHRPCDKSPAARASNAPVKSEAGIKIL